MSRQIKTERAAQQQHQICASLVRLMETVPYGEITVSRICAQAGIPRRTFYYYFDGKEDVLTLLIQGLMMESQLESMLLSNTSKSQLEQSLTLFFCHWRDKRARELRALIHSGLEQELTIHCVRWIHEEDSWAHLMENYAEEERNIGLMLGISSVLYALFHWCKENFRQNPEYMAACVTRILTKPLYKED